jgi:hypothetical protein
MDYASEADAYKRLLQTPEIGVTEAHYNAPAQAPAQAPTSLAASQAQAVQQDSLLEMPQSPLEQVVEKNGKAKTLGKMALTALSGGLLAPVLMPELMGAGKKYEAEMEAYKKEKTTANLAERISQIDFDNIQPEDVPYLELASGSLGEFGTDMLASQMVGIGGDEKIAEAYGYTPYQWSQLSPEKKRDLSDRYLDQNGGAGAFDYRQRAEGKSPEQLQEQKSAELFGSAEGQQYGDDRKIITGVRGQVQAYDQGLESLGGIKTMLEDPENRDATGWPRIIRDAINTNTKEDGSMDAEMAAGVVDLISQATFGALSQSELDLLKGGLMDPTKSKEYNLGTIKTAMKRIENDRALALESAQGAADRYKGWEGQKDYDTLFKNDWLYNNVGEGSRMPSIPAYGNKEEISFKDYTEFAQSQRGPFDEPLTRDELVMGFAELREQSEGEYNAMMEKQKADAEAAKRARLGLDRPWPTVAGQE